MTTKDQKKVELGKRLAEYNCKKRKELKIRLLPIKWQINQDTTKGLKEETTKDPRRVEQCKKLQEYNRRKREAQKSKEQKSEEQKSEVLTLNQYSIEAVLAVGVIGGLGYYLYQAKKGEVNAIPRPRPPQWPKANKFEME